MNRLLQKSGNYFDKFFNAQNVRKVELLILRFAVLAFLIHLLIIFLGNNFFYFKMYSSSRLFANSKKLGGNVATFVGRYFQESHAVFVKH